MSLKADMPVLCPLADIPDGGSVGLTATWPNGERRRVLAVRRGDQVLAYVNSCPHIGAPLDLEPGKFLNFERTHIMCSTHGAIFRFEDGYCVRGPCVGKSLLPVPVQVHRGQVLLIGSLPSLPPRWPAAY